MQVRVVEKCLIDNIVFLLKNGGGYTRQKQAIEGVYGSTIGTLKDSNCTLTTAIYHQELLLILEPYESD